MRLILFFIFFLVVCNFASAQTPKEDSIKAEIIKLSDDWNKAVISKDSVILDRILSPDFTLATNGPLLPRAPWIQNTLHVLFTDSLEYIGPQKITVYGNQAISEGVLYWKVRNDKNNLRNNESLVADIWRYNGGKWQVVHRMAKVLRKR